MSKGTSSAVINRYMNKVYKRINLQMYNYEVDAIRAIAAEKGMTVTQYICHAINALGDIQLSAHDKTGVEVLAEKRAAAAAAEKYAEAEAEKGTDAE